MAGLDATKTAEYQSLQNDYNTLELKYKELIGAGRQFMNYVKEYSNPVYEEPRYTRFRRALGNARVQRKAKVLSTD